MVSQKKLEANRLNAQKSTGPTSKEGKASASRNATQHGMYSADPVLADEDQAEYQKFRQALVDDLAPGGVMQEILVDRIVANAWRLRRIAQVEQWIMLLLDETGNEHYHRRNAQQDHSCPAELMALKFINRGGEPFDALSRYEQRLQRGMQGALRQLLLLKKNPASDADELTNRKSQITKKDQEPNSQSQIADHHVLMVGKRKSQIQKVRNEPTDAPNPWLDIGQPNNACGRGSLLVAFGTAK